MNNFDAHAYTITVKRIWVDGEHCFYARVAGVPDISSYSGSMTEAYDDVIEALKMLHEDAHVQGKAFPVPFKSDEKLSFSGQVTLRISRSMHADISRCAEEDGVSLNQWIVESLAQRRGAAVDADIDIQVRSRHNPYSVDT